jgi:hypothetical protein
MSDVQHDRFQCEPAKRSAYQVVDPDIREKLLEMADEHGRYGDLIETKAAERIAGTAAD